MTVTQPISGKTAVQFLEICILHLFVLMCCFHLFSDVYDIGFIRHTWNDNQIKWGVDWKSLPPHHTHTEWNLLPREVLTSHRPLESDNCFLYNRQLSHGSYLQCLPFFITLSISEKDNLKWIQSRHPRLLHYARRARGKYYPPPSL